MSKLLPHSEHKQLAYAAVICKLYALTPKARSRNPRGQVGEQVGGQPHPGRRGGWSYALGHRDACVRARAYVSTRARFLTHCPANSGRRVRELVRLLGAGWGGARVIRALADTVPACECHRAPAGSPQYSAAAFWLRAGEAAAVHRPMTWGRGMQGLRRRKWTRRDV